MKTVVIVTTEQGRDVLKAAGIKFDSLTLPEQFTEPPTLKADDPVQMLGISDRVTRKLNAGDIKTLRHLCNKTFEDVYKLPGISISTAQDLVKRLGRYGYVLKEVK